MEQIYKGTVFSENICSNEMMKALYYLLQKSELYQMEDIHIDDDWRERLAAHKEMQGNDHYFNEKTDSQNADYQEDHIQGKCYRNRERLKFNGILYYKLSLKYYKSSPLLALRLQHMGKHAPLSLLTP